MAGKEKKGELRRVLVRPQTMYHLQVMAMQMGLKYPGQVVDKMIRSMRDESWHASN